MKIALLYDSKFGNTKQLAEFLADQLVSNGYDVQTFRTKKTIPLDLLNFEPEVILVGSPTHGPGPALTLRKYLKNIGKLIKAGTPSNIKKAAVFNCNCGRNVCEDIACRVQEILPQLEIYEIHLPIKVGGIRGPLPATWQTQALEFISGFLSFLNN